MADIEFFNVAFNQFEKATAVAITATSDASPQTVVTMTTPSLPAGDYMITYSFQATHSGKNQPMFYKIDGTYADANYFSNAASDNDQLHVNRLYGFPKAHAGGVITMTLLVYKPTGTVVCDFADVICTRIG